MKPFEEFPVTSIGGMNALKKALDFMAAIKELQNMYMNAQYKRAVRIVSKPDDTHGMAVTIYDKETGEALNGIKSAVIYLHAGLMNIVELTYYETNEQGNILTDAQREPIIHTTTSESNEHEFYITAYEVNR